MDQNMILTWIIVLCAFVVSFGLALSSIKISAEKIMAIFLFVMALAPLYLLISSYDLLIEFPLFVLIIIILFLAFSIGGITFFFMKKEQQGDEK